MISRVMLNNMVESTMIASRVGVDDLEKHLRQKRLRWFEHILSLRLGFHLHIDSSYNFIYHLSSSIYILANFPR